MSIILSVAAGVLAALLSFKVVMLVLGGVSVALISEAAEPFQIRDQTVLKSIFAFIAILASLAAAAFAGMRVWAFAFDFIEAKRSRRRSHSNQADEQ